MSDVAEFSGDRQESLWDRTDAVDYMGDPQRADHRSHSVVTAQLRSWYGGTTFDLLDCGVMSGITYQKLADTDLDVRYTGIDVGELLVRDCRERFPDARWHHMSMVDLEFASDSFDVVHCRHVIEHLPYYETAVREAFRAARRHVVICLFEVPRSPEILYRRQTANGYIWLNRYAAEPLESLLDTLAGSVEAVDVEDLQRRHRIYFCTK